jgi:hypothetical protein
MDSAIVLTIIILAPVLVYVVARLVFTAYFHAKATYLRRFFKDTKISNDDTSP